jgi:hypothetical protein
MARPTLLKKMVHLYTNHDNGFYCFWMFWDIDNLIQRYPLVVDRNLATNLNTAHNMFCQIAESQDITLTILEKVWFKYVLFSKIKSSGRYVDRILFAFLGQPTMKIKCATDELTTKLLIDELQGEESISFCYLKRGLDFGTKPTGDTPEKRGSTPVRSKTRSATDFDPAGNAGFMALETEDDLPFRIAGVYQKYEKFDSYYDNFAVILETLDSLDLNLAFIQSSIVDLVQKSEKFKHLFGDYSTGYYIVLT